MVPPKPVPIATPLQHLAVRLVEPPRSDIPPHQRSMILVAAQLALAEAGIQVPLLQRYLKNKKILDAVHALEVDGRLVGLPGLGDWNALAHENLDRRRINVLKPNFYSGPVTESVFSIGKSASLESLREKDALLPIGLRQLNATGLELIERCLPSMRPLVQEYELDQSTSLVPSPIRRGPRL